MLLCTASSYLRLSPSLTYAHMCECMWGRACCVLLCGGFMIENGHFWIEIDPSNSRKGMQ